MSLPTSRNTSYTTDGPVKSVDLNDLQDCIVEGKHGLRYQCIPAIAGFHDGNWSIGGNGNRFTSTAAGVLYLPIAAFVGDQIGDLVVYRFGNAAADITGIDVYVVEAATGTQTSINTGGATVTVTNPAASITATVVAVDDYVLDVAETAFVRIAVNAAGISIYNSMIAITHP